MDDLSRLLGGAEGASTSDPTVSGSADPAAALGALGGAVQGAGGLDGLMEKLRGAGLGDAVDSWVSTGPNQPVDPDALGQALGPETVSQLSGGTGIDVAQLLPMLAAFLPQIIDMLTPDGNVPDGGLDQAAGSMPDVGGLLGGLLGGATGSSGAASPGLDDVLGGLGGLLGGKGG